MEEAEVLELYNVNYSDLMLLRSSSTNNKHNGNSFTKEEELQSIRRSIIEKLGPTGPGLISISNVPNVSLLRNSLLPLAPRLSLLPPEYRNKLLKEHKLGSDVPLKNPERNVSSFAMQLKYDELIMHALDEPNYSINVASNSDHRFENLGKIFKELGYCMMEVGLSLARICDDAMGGQELEQSLLESGTAKGRLIHYHSVLDNFILKGSGKRGGKQLKESSLVKNGNKFHGNLWQQWHYDYGIFTVLTTPMFLDSFGSSERVGRDESLVFCDQELAYPSGNSYLQIFDPNRNKVFMVKTSPENFIVQVGESADILSKGRLRSTLHCVSRPARLETVSRETFVVFLQPSWSKTFSTFDSIGERTSHFSDKGSGHEEHNLDEVIKEIHKVVPPLSSRLKDGMTFAEFSRETTKQYYGGSGLQSNK